VKKFQKARKLTADGQAGARTLSALFSKLSAGTSGTRSSALNALLGGLGYSTTGGSGFGPATVSSLKAFQAVAGRSARDSVDANTWAALFMALDSTQPRIAGTAKVGQTVAAGAGSWGPGSVSLSYQWYRGTTAISGAHSTNYAVQAGDAGSKLSVKVSGLRTGYTLTARTSATTVTVATATFQTAPAPAINGTARVGKTLKATTGAWSPSGVALTYQWYRDSAPIKGATRSTYKLTKASLAHRITVTVTGRKSGYTTLSKKSPVTRRVTMP
jgi:peptidoglycan hydrolase-like protein with peptidoglycan-binding domain